MASIEELRTERKEKRDKLIAAGMDPYPATSARTHSLQTILDDFSTFVDEATDVWVAGRIMAIREHGDVVFFDIFDGTSEIQVVMKRDEISDEKLFTLFVEAIDVGDFVDVHGVAFYTETDQASILLREWNIIAKAIRPIPDQYHGLKDKETRFRKRYLDILMNDEIRNVVEKRALFWGSIRSFLEERDFLEVQTPILETAPGGADARAFESHHNALDIDVYLRISAGELWQKKLLIAGFDKVFEIGRVFRNEGISPEHAQDYMQMEFYWAYADYSDGMDFVRELYQHIAETAFGTLTFTIGEHEVDLGSEWKQYDYVDTIEQISGIDIEKASVDDIATLLESEGITLSKTDKNRVRAVDRLWKLCRKEISGPGFLVNVPKELSPLAKAQSGDDSLVAQFQPIIAGSEVGKGYSELNNPDEQAARFRDQEQLRAAGDEEAQRYDESFIEALEHGMPPACGFGVSERLFSFLMDLPIREAQIFPLLKPDQ